MLTNVMTVWLGVLFECFFPLLLLFGFWGFFCVFLFFYVFWEGLCLFVSVHCF